MLLRLSIILTIVLATMGAAGAWIYMNKDQVYGTSSQEVASADAADPVAQADYPTAERNLGRLSGHFKAAPPPQKKKSAWSFW